MASSKCRKNRFEAAFSIPYGIAVALADGAAGLCQFTEERIKDTRLLNLCKNINVNTSDKYTAEYPANWGCEMNVYTRDGRVLNKLVWNGKGSADNPLTKDDLILKFKSLAGERMQENQMDRIIDGVYNLDQIADVSEFTTLLVR